MRDAASTAILSCPRMVSLFFSFLSLLKEILKRRLRRRRRHRDDGANDEVEEEPCWAQHQREEQHRRQKPCADPPLLAIQIDPAPDKQVKGEKVHPRDGCTCRRAQERCYSAERWP